MKNLLDRNEIVLMHGTSTEAIAELLRDGALKLKYFSNNPHNSQRGYIYFAPYAQNIPPHIIPNKRKYYEKWEDVIEMARDYAHLNAIDHYVALKTGYYDKEIAELPWPKKNEEIFPSISAISIETLILEKYLGILNKRGISKEVAMQILRDASKRKGSIIGLGKDVLELQLLEDRDEGVAIYLPNGLDVKYIIAIQNQ